MRIDRWPLIAAAAVIVTVVGVMLRKRRDIGETPKLHQEDVDRGAARAILREVYTIRPEALEVNFQYFRGPMEQMPEHIVKTAEARRAADNPLSVDEWVALLEEAAGVISLDELRVQTDGAKERLLSTGYTDGILPVWAGRWYHGAVSRDKTPSMEAFDVRLRQHSDE